MPPRSDRARLRRAAASILAAGLRAADPGRLVRAHLAREVRAGGSLYNVPGRCVLAAAGKAASRMAAAAEKTLGGRLDEALAVDTASTARLHKTRVRLAGHPAPD